MIELTMQSGQHCHQYRSDCTGGQKGKRKGRMASLKREDSVLGLKRRQGN